MFNKVDYWRKRKELLTFQKNWAQLKGTGPDGMEGLSRNNGGRVSPRCEMPNSLAPNRFSARG